MNFVEIAGGLGNQMFQYTFSKYLETVTGKPALLYLNYFDYAAKDPNIICAREFDLSCFNVRYSSVKGTVKYGKLVTDAEFVDDPGSIPLGFYKGYWQDKRYFESISDVIKTDLCLNPQYITSDIEKEAKLLSDSDSVSIHIRRNDYQLGNNKEIFFQLDASYYESALEYLSDVLEKDLTLFVFSDDLDYVKNNYVFLNLYEHHFMTGHKAYEDLYLMTRARHHIIANSTFSWWGAVLSDCTDGITIAPRHWYRQLPDPNLYFDNWIKL